jgi:hypothetical protein
MTEPGGESDDDLDEGARVVSDLAAFAGWGALAGAAAGGLVGLALTAPQWIYDGFAHPQFTGTDATAAVLAFVVGAVAGAVDGLVAGILAVAALTLCRRFRLPPLVQLLIPTVVAGLIAAAGSAWTTLAFTALNPWPLATAVAVFAAAVFVLVVRRSDRRERTLT